MKLIHLSDLHLGKRVNGFSMLDDQTYILEQIHSVICSESPDAVLIAGDVYDRTTPPAEAVRLFDDFLVRLSERGVPVIVISGNHDSAERLSFGARLMEGSGVKIAPVYDGTVTPVTLTDAHGQVKIWPLPFLRRAQVQRYFPESALIPEKARLSELFEEGEDVNAFLLRFALTTPHIGTVICGSGNPAHIRANVRAAGRGGSPAEGTDQ